MLPHPGHAAALAEMAALADALVDADGGTPSRAPEDLAEVLTLLIWTARLLDNAGQQAMAPHLQAIVRAVPVIRPLRMGDGGVARFHGGGAGHAGAARPGAGRAAPGGAAEAAAPHGLRAAGRGAGGGADGRRGAAGRARGR